MSPLNRGSPLGSRILPAGARPLPPPRFGGRPAITGMPQRIPLPPRMPSPPRMRRMPPLNRMFSLSDPRHRIPLPPPPPPPQPPRPVSGGGGMSRLNGVPPLFPGGPRARGHLAPIAPPIAPSMGPRGPFMRPWPRRMLPPQMMPPMRPMRYNTNNGTLKGKPIRNAKKINNRAGGQKTRDNNSTIESEGVQKTVNTTEQSEQTDHTEEKQPSSEQAQP